MFAQIFAFGGGFLYGNYRLSFLQRKKNEVDRKKYEEALAKRERDELYKLDSHAELKHLRDFISTLKISETERSQLDDFTPPSKLPTAKASQSSSHGGEHH